MAQEENHGGRAAAALEADAVCAACGTVNPEDTFLCKTCGNNLREQRARRIASQAEAEMATMPHEGGWLSKALVVLGILVVLWTTINLGRIENWLVAMQDMSDPKAYWRGEQGELYSALAAELGERLPEVVREEARNNPEADVLLSDGRYVVYADDGTTQSRYVGDVAVRMQGGVVYFVMLSPRGGVEIRGRATLEIGDRYACREMAGVRVGLGYYMASGVVLSNPEGGFDCYGQSEYSDRSYQGRLFRVSR